MPLTQGKSHEAISSNIAELVKAGHPQKQAEAIAYAVARRNGAKDDLAGGALTANSGVPAALPRKARDEAHSKGNIRRLIRDLVEFFHEEENEDDDEADIPAGDALSDETWAELNKDASPDKLSERTRAEIGKVGSEKREELPESDFLEPGAKKYPVKKDGKYDRKLLTAAASEARMHGHEDLAKRADAIRAREFAEDSDNPDQPRDEDGKFASSHGYKETGENTWSKIIGEHPNTKTTHTLHVSKTSSAPPFFKADKVSNRPDTGSYTKNIGNKFPSFEKAHRAGIGEIDSLPGVVVHDSNDTALVMDWSSAVAARALASPLALDWAVGAALRTKNNVDVAFAFDRESMRSLDKDGRLHVAKAHISKANICEYFGKEIPGWQQLGLDPERKYKMLRDPAELKKAEKTFNNLPILSTHIPTDVDNHPKDETIGTTGTDAEFDGAYLNNSLAFWTREALDGIESGDQRELSSAYAYTPDMTPGKFLGENYDGVMRNIVGNHLALVESGRAGSDVKVADSVAEHLWTKIELAIVEMERA